MGVIAFDLNYLKEAIRDTIRAYLNPNNLISDTSVALSNSISVYDIAQSFIPFSKCYATTSPYRYTIETSFMIKKTGTPDSNVIVSLQSSTNDYPSGTTISSSTISESDISSTFDVKDVNLKITTMLGSNTKYWYCIEPQCTASTVNFYSIAKSATQKYMIGNLAKKDTTWSNELGSMIFDISVPQWVFQDYPRDDINKYSFPRLAIDIVSRRVEQRWINTEFADYTIDVIIMVYSNYPDELDKIISYVDRAIFKERTLFYGIRRIDPGELSPVAVIRDNLFSRSVSYSMLFRMTNQ
jgi:hypothetical protein